jgi:hypothetical protein
VKKDPGIIGAFWFRRAHFFTEAADALIHRNVRINNEFYVDSAIPMLIETGHCVRVLDVMHYISFGAPDDVRTFEYWDSYFKRNKGEDPYGGKEDKPFHYPSLL